MSFYHVHKGDLVNLLKPGLLFSRNQSGNHYLDGNDEIMAFAKSCLLSCHYLPVFSDKYLTHCLLGNFSCFFCRLLIFFEN